jgi:tetratricopeptide (TPR) repeat protein
MLLPLFVMGLVMGCATVWLERSHVGAEGPDWSQSPIERLLLAARIPWFYAAKLVWPANLMFVYPMWKVSAGDPLGWLWLALTCGIFVALWFLRSRWGRGPITAAAFFLITLFPALGFFNVYPMRYSFVADHFQYLASLGPLVLIGHGFFVACSKRDGLKIVVALVLIALLGTLARQRAYVLADGERLWVDTIRRNPGAWMAYNNLGSLLLEQGRLREARERFNQSMAIRPDNVEAYINMGNMEGTLGRFSEAEKWYRKALRQDESNYFAINGLGIALIRQKRNKEAIDTFRSALERAPGFSEARSNLAKALMAAGNHEEAVRELQAGIEKDPSSASLQHAMGLALIASGDPIAGERHLREALRLQPDDVDIFINLSKCLSDRGLLVEAADLLSRAVNLRKDNFRALVGLGDVLARMGRATESLRAFELALELNPHDPGLHERLAVVLAALGRTDEADAQRAEFRRLQAAP